MSNEVNDVNVTNDVDEYKGRRHSTSSQVSDEGVNDGVETDDEFEGSDSIHGDKDDNSRNTSSASGNGSFDIGTLKISTVPHADHDDKHSDDKTGPTKSPKSVGEMLNLTFKMLSPVHSKPAKKMPKRAKHPGILWTGESTPPPCCVEYQGYEWEWKPCANCEVRYKGMKSPPAAMVGTPRYESYLLSKKEADDGATRG